MKRKSWTVHAFALLIASVYFLSIFASWGQAADPAKLSMASFNSGSGWYVLAQSLSQIIKKSLPEGSIVDVLPYSGGSGNPPLLHQGKADLALGYPFLLYLAMRGEEPYKEKMKEIRMLVAHLDSYWYLFALRQGTPISSFNELKQKKFPLRLVMTPKGSTGEWMNNAALKAYGMTFEDIKSWGGKVTMTSFPNAIQMLKDGQADAFGHVATPGHPAWTELSTLVDLKFVPLDKGIIEKLAADYGLGDSMVPKGSFRGIAESIPTVGWSTSVATTTKLQNDIAYKIVEAICTHKKEIEAAYKGAKVFDPQKAWQTAIPLHPGAEKYYKEKGYK